MLYISPIWFISIGQYKIERMNWFNVYSSRRDPTDHAEVELPLEGLNLSLIAKEDPIIVSQGYREHGLWRIFKGTVDDIYPEDSTAKIIASDGMKQLKQKISKAFVSVTPQEIVRFGLAQVGIQNFQLGAAIFPHLPSFIANESMVAILKRVKRDWKGLDSWDYYFDPEDQFYFGPWEEAPRYQQSHLPELIYGGNILTHVLLDENRGLLEIPILPYLRHSHRIRITDPRYWRGSKKVRIEKVKYHHSNKARMELEWIEIPS